MHTEVHLSSLVTIIINMQGGVKNLGRHRFNDWLSRELFHPQMGQFT